MRQRLRSAVVALVLQIEIEREAVRLADVFGEERFHIINRQAPRTPRQTIHLRARAHASVAVTVLDHVMAPAERRFAARAQVVDQPRGVFRLQALVPGVVDHHHRRPIAGAETLDFEQRERAARVGLARLRCRASRRAPRSPARRRSARTTACGRPAARTSRPAWCRTSCRTTRRPRRRPA